MNQDNANTEVHTVKMQKSTFWNFIKYVFAFAMITYLGNTFAYTIVGYNHVWSKLIGLVPEAVIEFCANCLQALGG